MQLFNQMILNTMIKSSILVLCTTLLVVNAANALQSDFKEMITVDSDKQFADIENDHVIFTDNVEIHQGTIYIKAHKVEVFRENPNKKGQHTKLIAYGTENELAIYEQTMDDQSRIHAQGMRLSYDVSIKEIEVVGKAYVKKQDNIIQSDRVVYDMNKGHMVATVNKGQVRTILIPDQLEDADKKKDKEQKNKDQKAPAQNVKEQNQASTQTSTTVENKNK